MTSGSWRWTGEQVVAVAVVILRPGAAWEKVADLKTARWGRPSVGTIGGKITGDTAAVYSQLYDANFQ